MQLGDSKNIFVDKVVSGYLCELRFRRVGRKKSFGPSQCLLENIFWGETVDFWLARGLREYDRELYLSNNWQQVEIERERVSE